MTSRFRSTVVAACAVVFATVASAQTTIQLGGKSTLTIKGFISATAFVQDQQFTFGNGQNAEWPTPPQSTVDRWFGGGDVRNTRLTLAFDGPKVGGDWKVGATLEMDFFGGFNGTGGFSGQQPVPRLRLGFVDITNGRTTIRIGQQWSPLFGNVPVSLSHIAFPLGYGSAGMIGWRFPGIFIYQTLTPKGAPVNAEVQVAVMQGSWNTPGSTIDNTTPGNATSPQYEVRVNVSGKAGKGTWSAYIVGHEDNKDFSLANSSAAKDKMESTAYEAGAKFQFGPVMLQGNFYSGHSIGQNFGAISQFQNGCPSPAPSTACPASRRDRIASTGGWAQLGVDMTPNWSIFGFWGEDNPKDNDVKNVAAGAGRNENILYAAMLRWRTGPYALGFEYLHSRLLTGPTNVKTTGNQLALSTLFNF
jgi:hypothetical protein